MSVAEIETQSIENGNGERIQQIVEMGPPYYGVNAISLTNCGHQFWWFLRTGETREEAIYKDDSCGQIYSRDTAIKYLKEFYSHRQ